jgi:hypothetical protein
MKYKVEPDLLKFLPSTIQISVKISELLHVSLNVLNRFRTTREIKFFYLLRNDAPTIVISRLKH